MRFIDNFLNSITMYRLVLYYLIVMLILGGILSFFNFFRFTPVDLILSTAFILAVGYVTNQIFAHVFKVPANTESIYISSLILSLIITPSIDTNVIPFLFWSGVWIAASKFIFALNRKHLFNPAAFAVLIGSLALSGSASWWVGSTYLALPGLIGGLLIVRKIRRFDLWFTFMGAALMTISVLTFLNGNDPLNVLMRVFTDSPIIFFSTVMLTEPLTMPPTRPLRILYGALTGFLFAPQLQVAGLFTTPESALIIGNIISYLVSPKEKLLLKLKEKIQLAPNIYDFVFSPDKKPHYTAGQYMEWTLGHHDVDSRGNRRYFTLASSPTEDTLRVGIRFNEPSSSFKKRLLDIKVGDEMLAGSLAGDFTLIKDRSKKLVFIAGGIGVTPFRSIVKYLIDSEEIRDIVMLYSVKSAKDAVYSDLFEQAVSSFNMRYLPVITDPNAEIPADWKGLKGLIDQNTISTNIPDYKERTYYISGPHAMVAAFEKTLSDLGVGRTQIKIDYFPGFA